MTSFIDYDSQMTPGYDIEISCIFTDSTKNRFQLFVSFTFELSINSRADVCGNILDPPGVRGRKFAGAADRNGWRR